MTRSILTLMLFALMAGTPAYSDGILFDASWKEQRFSLFSKNKYGFKGNRLDVSSRGSVSMAYTAVSEMDWAAKSASWSWTVGQGVPATDLRNFGQSIFGCSRENGCPSGLR